MRFLMMFGNVVKHDGRGIGFYIQGTTMFRRRAEENYNFMLTYDTAMEYKFSPHLYGRSS